MREGHQDSCSDYASLLAGVRISPALRIGVLIAAVCLFAQAQNTPSQNETRGLPPRATAADYQAQAQAGTFAIAAEFKGHSVPTPEATLSTEDYVVVEAALFGQPEARLKLSIDDFSLRINGKKTPLPCASYALVFGSLKDPEWEPPEKAEPKSKTSIGGGGKSGQGDSNMPPPVVHIPIELQRAMQQKVRKAAPPEGTPPPPQAGPTFFHYRTTPPSTHLIQLLY